MITLFKDPFFDVVDKVFDTTKVVASPQSTIRKNESEYKVFLSIPGLTKEDLKLSIKDGVLKISFEKEEKDERVNFVNNFTKTYVIPDNVREKDIVGKVENGILEVVLPIDKKKSLERLISLN